MSELLLKHFDLLALAPDGVSRLRELILTLAVQGKLVPQDPNDEPASVLLQRIRTEKDRLIAEGRIKRDKTLLPIDDDEKLFELPKGWEWVRIPEISYNLGQCEPTVPFSYIDVAAIDNSRGVITPEVQIVQPANAPSRARKIVQVGTVLYSTVRPYLKNIAVVENDLQPKPIASTAFAVIHPHTGVKSRYLLHYLRSQPFTEFVNSKAVGVAYPAINDANFFQGVVPLPPATEQARIVDRVEELMRLCDALEAKQQLDTTQHAQLVQTLLGTLSDSTTREELATAWQRVATHFDLLLNRPESIDALEQTILQLAVRGLLTPQDPTDEPASVLLQHIRAEKDRLIAEGKIKRDKPLPPIPDEEKPFELPQGWEWVRFGDASINRDAERIPVSSTEREGRQKIYDYYGASGVIDKIDSYLFEKPLLLIGEDGANLINRSTPIAFIARGKYWVNNHAHVIDTTEPTLMNFLALFINAISLEPYVTGTAQPKMNQAKLNSIPIALPPISEQARIISRVEELRSICNDISKRLTASRITQAHLAEALVEAVATA